MERMGTDFAHNVRIIVDVEFGIVNHDFEHVTVDVVKLHIIRFRSDID